MATRPIFKAINTAPFFKELNVEFQFFSGFSLAQKQRSIASLHFSARNQYRGVLPLEVSTKGETSLGNRLSAFNLKYYRKGQEYSLESVFQGSKVFELGGPYEDIYDKEPKEAKHDERLRTSGNIVCFKLDDALFPREPKDFFYNWIYSSALYRNKELLPQLEGYNAFSDIEFNPQKSINCQARTVAIVRGLLEAGKLDEAMRSPEDYLRIVYGKNTQDSAIGEQTTLF